MMKYIGLTLLFSFSGLAYGISDKKCVKLAYEYTNKDIIYNECVALVMNQAEKTIHYYKDIKKPHQYTTVQSYKNMLVVIQTEGDFSDHQMILGKKTGFHEIKDISASLKSVKGKPVIELSVLNKQKDGSYSIKNLVDSSTGNAAPQTLFLPKKVVPLKLYSPSGNSYYVVSNSKELYQIKKLSQTVNRRPSSQAKAKRPININFVPEEIYEFKKKSLLVNSETNQIVVLDTKSLKIEKTITPNSIGLHNYDSIEVIGNKVYLKAGVKTEELKI
ncbi:MAG: hypothetical protein ACPGJV_01490 [Bacteriovoracaceae bacterium]